MSSPLIRISAAAGALVATAGLGYYVYQNWLGGGISYTKDRQIFPPAADGKAKGMGMTEEKGPLQLIEFPLHDLGPTDVELRIVACGVCHSDVHTMDGDWGKQEYPLVVGHEIIGYVTRVGDRVRKVSIGQRVGVGPTCKSCDACAYCNDGHEVNCPKAVFAYSGKYKDGYASKGGYSTYIRCAENWVFAVPDVLPTDAAAPLLCAGATTFTPLREAQIGPGSKVAILGLGGLGHLGLQFAAALGAEVSAVSRNKSKEEEAKALGATRLISSSDPEEMKQYAQYFDLVMDTTCADISYDEYIKLVKSRGRFILIGVPPKPFKCELFPVIVRNLNICGSVVGSPEDFEAMLELAARKNVKAVVEPVDFSRTAEAVARCRASLPHFRCVLKIPTDL